MGIVAALIIGAIAGWLAVRYADRILPPSRAVDEFGVDVTKDD